MKSLKKMIEVKEEQMVIKKETIKNRLCIELINYRNANKDKFNSNLNHSPMSKY